MNQMKIIRLNKRYRLCRDLGHPVALKFQSWMPYWTLGSENRYINAAEVEAQCWQLWPWQKLDLNCALPELIDRQAPPRWAVYRTPRRRDIYYSTSDGGVDFIRGRPFYISFREEPDLTLLLLRMDLT